MVEKYKEKVEYMIKRREMSSKECYCEVNKGVPMIRFRCLDGYDFVSLAFSTRLGGVTDKDYLSSLNFGWDRGDKEENVRENYRRMCKALGTDYKKLILSDQVHGDKIEYVDERYAAGEKIEKKLKGVDGMVTDKKGLTLATSFADCVPLFFIDTVGKVIGSSHSGWRGTVARIGQKTIKKMAEQFGSRPEDIICIIGPSICRKCYEVSEDVIRQFQKNFPEDCWDALFYQKENQKYQLNLWKANELIFYEAGILPEHIAVTNLCTHCNSEILYSHRQAGDARGNLCAFLALNQEV